MTKIGRNDLCPCGSQKKYKKCHLDEDEKKNQPIPLEVLKIAEEIARKPKTVESFEQGGFLVGRPFVDTTSEDKLIRFRAVGNTVYKRPFGETFHQFLLWHFLQFLTPKWTQGELLKDVSFRSPLATWINEYQEVTQSHDQNKSEEIIHSVAQTAGIKHLISLAYDFYSLAHCKAKILPKLIKRLEKKDHFQGARYEIAVGGIAVRAGFDIHWETDEHTPHSEFLGIHKVTGDKAGFEAKSHHRPGVLGREGLFDSAATGVKIFDHIREAIGQSDKKTSLIVFDDLNLPLDLQHEGQEKNWFKSVDDHFKSIDIFKKLGITNFSALFLTNFSWHFHDNLPPQTQPSEVLGIWSQNQPFSLKPETINLLKSSAEQYGSVPARIEEIEEIKKEIAANKEKYMTLS